MENAGTNALTKDGHMTATGQSLSTCPALLPRRCVSWTEPDLIRPVSLTDRAATSS
jgi:hypothetical protein